MELGDIENDQIFITGNQKNAKVIAPQNFRNLMKFFCKSTFQLIIAPIVPRKFPRNSFHMINQQSKYEFFF